METQAFTKDVFTRKKWRELYIDQLGYSINLFIIMVTGSIGFCLSQLTTSAVHNSASVIYINALKGSIVLFFVSILSGVACTFVRLIIFHKRYKGFDYELPFVVAMTFVCQIGTFGAGAVWLGEAAFRTY
jgi:hypothetical protein